MSTLDELEAKLDRLVNVVSQLVSAPKEVLRVPSQPPKPSGATGDGKNPCGCGSCTPQRVSHWYCSVCSAGPYKFSSADPGNMQALRPHFTRGLQKYLTDGAGVGRWHYGARYCCTQGCAAKELRLQNASLVDVANSRPDLADAITAQLEAGGVGGLAAAHASIPDLGTIGSFGDGATAGGGDDLE